MTLLEAVVLAVLQGFTEFLPISSSGHLILVPTLMGWDDQGLAFDIAVHFGTLISVIVYFRSDLAAMLRSLGNAARGTVDADARLALQLCAASVPIGIAGWLFVDFIEAQLRTPVVIAVTTGVFGIALWLSDRYGRRRVEERNFGWAAALFVGMAQVLALIPGTSRSGITMTAALAAGMTREAAGRFAFLLAIPAICMAAGWQALQLLGTNEPLPWAALILGTAVAAAVAFATIAVFLKLIGRIGMVWFAVYRLALAAVLLWVVG
ncbi:MAG TPA: undecaprenyl-diphosphate phosphatase [Gammaproteobacteria bacterium]|nr:undecaprenyl-diphosphate phosphatase [Gammaproteobacteria bacterium]